MIKNLLSLGLIFFVFLTSAQNFVATYSFANVSTSTGTVDPGAPPQINGLTFGSFSYLGTASNPNASGRFSFTGWPVGALDGDDDYSNYTAALSPSVYYETTLKVLSGYTLDLNTITFAVRRSGTGIRNYVVRSSRDNFNNNLAASTGTNSKLSVLPGDVFFWNYDSISTAGDQRGSALLLNTQFKGIVDSVVFRFYAWNSESSGGTFSIDNVSFAGTLKDSNTVLTTIEINESEEAGRTIRLYPNPVNRDRLTLSGNLDLRCLELFSVGGEKFECPETKTDPTSMDIDVSQLRAGIYFLREGCGAKRSSSLFIVRDE